MWCFVSFQHMVQNQMNPSYPQFTQTGLEDYSAQNGTVTPTSVPVSAATVVVTDPAQVAQTFKDQTSFMQTAISSTGAKQNAVALPETVKVPQGLSMPTSSSNVSLQEGVPQPGIEAAGGASTVSGME